MRLEKEQKFIIIGNCTKKVRIGVNYHNIGDVDMYLIAVNKDLKILDEQSLVYYNNHNAYNAMRFTSESNYLRYDESCEIEFDKLSADVYSIVVGAALYRARERMISFSGHESILCDVLDDNGQTLMIRHRVSKKMCGFTGVMLGVFERYGNDWIFEKHTFGTFGAISEIPEKYDLV